jgi:hypothetical protein
MKSHREEVLGFCAPKAAMGPLLSSSQEGRDCIGARIVWLYRFGNLVM